MIARAVRVTNGPDYPPATIEAICRDFSIEKIVERMAHREIFIAFSRDVITGTISRKAARLHSLFVDPSCQNCGIGRALVSFFEDRAIGEGIEEFRLNSSLTAKSFYEKLGYGCDGLSDDKMTVMMSKSLVMDPPHPGRT